jgi:crotonobetainyl-CoA:carnitine CoA-transferase CaiB-like acyl-CoA transferase
MIPAGPVLSPQQALDHPHIRATGFMQDVDYPGLPIHAPVVRAAVRLSETLGEIVARPPILASIAILSRPNPAMTWLRLRRFDKAASFSGYAP